MTIGGMGYMNMATTRRRTRKQQEGADDKPQQALPEDCSVHGKPVLPLAKVIELSRESNLRCPMCGTIIPSHV